MIRYLKKSLIITISCTVLLQISTNLARADSFEELELDAALESKTVGRYLSGEYARRSNDIDTAATLYKSAVKESPNNPLLLRNSYKLMLYSGKLPEAFTYAENYVKYDQSAASANILVAIKSFKTGDYKKAEEILDNVAHNGSRSLSYNIDLVIVPFLKMWTKVGQGDYAIALDVLNKIDEKGGVPSKFLHYQRAVINDMAGNTEIARLNYEEIFKGDVLVKHNLVRSAVNFYLRHKEWDKAQSLIDLYSKQYPQFNHFVKEGRYASRHLVPDPLVASANDGAVEVFMEAIRALNSIGYLDESFAYLRVVEHLRPEDDEIKLLLAEYFDENEHHEKAIELYANIAKDSDYYINSQINMADSYYQIGNKAKAVEILSSIEEENSVIQRSLLTLADLLRKDKEYSKATSVYSRIIDKLPKVESHHWPIFFARGICHERDKQWVLAEKDLQEALQLKPNQPDVLNYLAYSWVDRGENIDQAKEMIEMAVNARPDDAQIIDSMGWVLFKMKNFKESADYLERAVELIPYDSVMNDHLGDAYWMMGRHDEARFQWQRVLKYNKDGEVSIKLIKEKLENGLIHKIDAARIDG